MLYCKKSCYNTTTRAAHERSSGIEIFLQPWEKQVVRIRHQVFLIILTTITVISIPVVVSPTQKASKFEIEQWREVLRDVKRELRSSYYDPEFHGMNIESRFEVT